MSGPYDDIIGLPRPVSKRRARMSGADRAAQFSPFAALTGFGATVDEAGRLTEARIELEVDAQAELDRKFARLRERAGEGPFLRITYFVPDGKKAGGAYETAAGHLKKLNEYDKYLLLEDGTKISLYDIVALGGEGAE